MPLIGFARDMVIPKGIVILSVTLKKVSHRVAHTFNFFIIDHQGAYNIILRRPFIATTKAMISKHYLAMKILTIGGNH